MENERLSQRRNLLRAEYAQRHSSLPPLSGLSAPSFSNDDAFGGPAAGLLVLRGRDLALTRFGNA